jgi:serine/threonine-protein kinase
MAVMYQHVQGKAAPLAEMNPNVPPELIAIVGKTMMVDKAKRYATMEELHAALASIHGRLT